MPAGRGVDITFVHGFLATRARAAKPRPSRVRTKRHARTASSRRRLDAVCLSLFGWQAHRQVLKSPAKKPLDRLHSSFTPSVVFSTEPSAPEYELLELSAPRFSANVFVLATAPPLTPTSLAWLPVYNYESTTCINEPSAPMLTPTCLLTAVY